MKELHYSNFVEKAIEKAFNKYSINDLIKTFRLKESYLYNVKEITRNILVLKWFTTERFITSKVCSQRRNIDDNELKLIGQALSQAILNYDYSAFEDTELKSQLLSGYQQQSNKYNAIMNSTTGRSFLDNTIKDGIANVFAKITNPDLSDSKMKTIGEKLYAETLVQLNNEFVDTEILFD